MAKLVVVLLVRCSGGVGAGGVGVGVGVDVDVAFLSVEDDVDLLSVVVLDAVADEVGKGS